MNDFFYRTEDISPEEVKKFFVETEADRELISSLKSRNPVVIVGSRGVGKSFLLRIAQKELIEEFPEERVFPVYLSFIKGSLLNTSDENVFFQWMLAKICSGVVRALSKEGLIGRIPPGINSLAGQRVQSTLKDFRIQEIVDQFESRGAFQTTPFQRVKFPHSKQLKMRLRN